jgi:hypothetical protein
VPNLIADSGQEKNMNCGSNTTINYKIITQLSDIFVLVGLELGPLVVVPILLVYVKNISTFFTYINRKIILLCILFYMQVLWFMGFKRHQPNKKRRKPRILDFIDAAALVKTAKENRVPQPRIGASADEEDDEEEQSPPTLRVLRSRNNI